MKAVEGRRNIQNLPQIFIVVVTMAVLIVMLLWLREGHEIIS